MGSCAGVSVTKGEAGGVVVVGIPVGVGNGVDVGASAIFVAVAAIEPTRVPEATNTGLGAVGGIAGCGEQAASRKTAARANGTM